MKKYQGIVIDAFSRQQFKGEITVDKGKIIRIEEKEHNKKQYILSLTVTTNWY